MHYLHLVGRVDIDCKSMDLEKRPNKLVGSLGNRIYMDLKDIIREQALPFLPAKSLFRLQGVCRDWKLQILAPFFAHKQSIYFREISGLFYQFTNEMPSFISIDPHCYGVADPTLKFLPEPVDIRASSNGLICCQGRTEDKAYYICNPVTKQWKKLPKANAVHGSDPAVVLVFEPSLLNFVAEYKLVCAFPSVDFDNATEFEIYSSAEGSWKISGEICFASRKLIPRSGVYVDGVVYWQAVHHGIVSFDLTKDRSQFIQTYHGSNSALGTYDGKLCWAYLNGPTVVLNVLSNVYSNTMDMHSRAKLWEMKTHFVLDGPTQVGFGQEQGVVLFVNCSLVVVQFGSRILCYDMKTKETKVLSREAEYTIKCVSYVNSLVYI
ncbi:hypothetical protein NMG60_11026176 [Bertholletia excelsa]